MDPSVLTDFLFYESARGDVRCVIYIFLYGSAPPAAQGFGGRAAVQPENGAVFTGRIRFKPDEPEHGANPA